MDSGMETASCLMKEYSERTGLGDAKRSTRYLWTDAFALVNALDLWCTTNERRWGDLATTLIFDVHRVLGQHRPDDPRTGWLSGLPEPEGERHPTAGGLRIGKPLPERLPSEPCDEQLEWDRDGQYWHYLTKWMDALLRAAAVLGESEYHRYAVELAKATFPRFLRSDRAGLHWKMSIDLSRPQVAGVSAHDALDGHVTFRWIGRAQWRDALDSEAMILRRLVAGEDWTTGDPLSLGGLLLDAARLMLLPDRKDGEERLIAAILSGVDGGLAHVLHGPTLKRPAASRLGFRELGLAIGMQAVTHGPKTGNVPSEWHANGRRHLQQIMDRADIEAQIIDFWSRVENWKGSTWTEHRDINEVMLATALLRAHGLNSATSRSTAAMQPCVQ